MVGLEPTLFPNKIENVTKTLFHAVAKCFNANFDRIKLIVLQLLYAFSTPDSDFVCEGSNPSPAANNNQPKNLDF